MSTFGNQSSVRTTEELNLARAATFPSADLVLLIDHANIDLRRDAIKRVVSFWASEWSPPPLSRAALRLYGGWFFGSVPTDARQDAAGVYRDSSPAVLRIPATVCRTTLEFADQLVGDSSSPRITHTVARRRRTPRFARAIPAPVCQDSNCRLVDMRVWMKKNRACSNRQCAHAFEEMHQFREQKQVDTHMTVDLLTLSQNLRNDQAVAVCTGDWDFIPPLLLASSGEKGPRIIWVRDAGDATYADSTLISNARFRLLEL